MKIQLASTALFLAAFATHAFAQDSTLVFSDFESGIPAGWTGAGTGVGQWKVLSPGECGAVTRMITLSAGAPTCNYSTTLPQGPNLLGLPPQALSLSGNVPLRLSFDYILDMDASGDQVLSFYVNNTSQVIISSITSQLVNDGQLRTVVIDMPTAIVSIGFTQVGLAFSADGQGDLGRGLLVDNVRLSRSSEGAIFCSAQTPVSCPCANGGLWIGRGCGNSTGAGAGLHGLGNPSVSNDTFRLGAFAIPTNAPILFFDGTSPVAAVFGDGKQCAGGTILRLGIRFAESGGSVFPSLGQGGFAATSGVTPGSTRYYQALYRDVGGPCSTGFNLTNGWRTTWGI
jgi:hypothetical protein